MQTAKLKLYQLAVTANGYEPDGAPYASEVEAEDAKAQQARDWMAGRYTDATSLQSGLEDYDIHTQKPLDEIKTLDDLSDVEIVLFAEERIGFNGHIYAIDVAISVYDLTEAIRLAGAAPTVFTVEDVIDRFDGTEEEAADWLVNNRRRLDDILSERGNEAIGDLLAYDGRLASEDDDEDEADGA
ncbi:hypothetical protein KIKIMORA_04860 [Brevundimonas phage vB_BpoS-Kikimora]|uniref:Uncharacterized protein n=1 Tax=Brevundimonas phage vB_BpoS-Kikimora TaxID=2948601 RepID=A0A9E7MT57_9CAUD|nr:hypothetical protein KIKIMORA_04860 [Brevundimonas phage vB_BpoS-Kikimora]